MLNVFSIIKEPLDIAKVDIPKSQKLLRVQEALSDVKLIPYEEFINKFPHELSGGQRQRVSLARALILKPNLLIADEPLSMLDVSLRAYMINLMEDMKKRYNLTILFITHDLAVARYFCDKISVIYKGKIMERGPSEVIFRDPKHPYTNALKEAVPEIGKKLIASNKILQSHEDKRGCPFRLRCKYRDSHCVKTPKLKEISPRHFVACSYIM